ncbi:MAG: GNAT family N-acetyltransferase, partial [Nitrososphaerota archaeon]
CDCISGDLLEVAENIVDKNGCIKDSICDFDDGLFYIERFYIKPEYRRKGIGSFAIEFLPYILEYTLNVSIGALTIIPNAGKDDYFENQKETKKLVEFANKHGFKKIRNSNVM